MARKSVVSINIGSRRTKIAVGSFEKEKIYIEKALVIDTPKGSLNDGRLQKSEASTSVWGNAILKALNDNKIRYRDAIVTIQSSMVIRRELEIPKVKPKDMESMIRYEIEQYLPIDLNEYIIEYTVQDAKQENKSRILIAAMPKAIAEDYYAMLGHINLVPNALDINSNAITKLFGIKQRVNDRDYNLESTAAFIDLGYKSINVTILSKGEFQFSRLVPGGGNELDAAIADLYGIPEEDAEKRKLQGIDLTASSEENYTAAINKAAQEVIARWTEDIQRVFQYYKSRNSNNSIDQIYLLGGTSNIHGIAEFFDNATGVSTQKIKSLGNVVLEKDASGSGVESFINSIGAIIRR